MHHDDMIAMKVAILEGVARDLLLMHFKETRDPLKAATEYAEARMQIRPGADPELEPYRQEIWQSFIDPVVAELRK